MGPLRSRTVLSLARPLLLAVALPSSTGAAQDCSVVGQNTFVASVLEDQYLWYQHLPKIEPASYASPEALLEGVRYRPFDATFSYISDQQSDVAFFSGSQYVGFGVSTQVAQGAVRVADVYEGSPAAAAGLERGDEILFVGGHPAAELVAEGTLSEAFGPAEPGFAVDIVFRGAGSGTRSARLTKAIVTIPTVSALKTFDIGGDRVGYFLFRTFVSPADQALEEAFAALRSTGATRLVLDLRYNGGGLLSVAQHLASLIGAPRLVGKVMLQIIHNDKHVNLDSVSRFLSEGEALDLASVVIIASRDTASASEVVINSLRPFMQVTVVGDRTAGQPVGEDGYEFCSKVLHPVVFAEENALDDGSYFEGLPPECPAPDDLDHLLGDPREASLAQALSFVQNGQCPTQGLAAQSETRSRALGERRAPPFGAR